MSEEEEENKLAAEKDPEKDPMELVNATNQAAERMEKANADRISIMKKQSEQETAKALAGRADAGGKENKEDTPEEYANKVMENDLDVK